MKRFFIILFTAIFLGGCVQGSNNQANNNYQLSNPDISIITPTETLNNESIPMSQNIKAIIHTSVGDMTVSLFPDKAPNTVANFVGLAKGTKEWTDPKSKKKVTGKPLYENVIFHRVIEDFMIQGGDPEGTGMGGPGYRFADEKVTDEYLRGTLAMANAGPNTNGSQFFIVHQDYPLPKLYTIFGRIDASDSASLAVLDKIATTPTNSQDRPLSDITIKSIDIIEE